MKNSRLLFLLKNLDRKEWQGLRKFLRSPYFNQREDVLRFFEYLDQQLARKNPRLGKATIFEQVFPGVNYDDATFHLLKTYLFKLVEQFLVVRTLEQQPVEAQLLLVRYYHDRQLGAHFDRAVGRLRKGLEKQSYRDSTYFERQRDIVWEEYQLVVRSRPSGDLPLQQLSELTDIAYFTQKLRQLCLLSAQQTVYTAEYGIAEDFRATYFEYIREQGFLEIPAISLYYHGYFLLNDPAATDHFQAFKALLIEHFGRFSSSEARELFLLAINFCVRKVNAGDTSYFAEMLALYKKGLEMATLLENGRLSRFTYHNVIATAIQVRDFDWAGSFAAVYRLYLAPEYQESSFLYNQARLAYEQGNYSEALRLIHQAAFSDVLLSLAAKTISLKIYYALQEYDLLDSHLDAMTNFIRRNKGLGYHRNNYLNLTRLTKKLLSLNRFDKAAVEDFRAEVSKEETLTERNWLLAQLA